LSTSATIAERSNFESVNAFVIDDDIRESLQELVGDDIALLAAYVADLLNEFPKLIQNLRNAIRDQNANAISLAAHSLKGVGLTFRAKRLVELCQIVELKANVGITAIAPEEHLQLERELEQLIAALEREF
jgi:HPt (histidine-containing phosphotransfer) domain-containing protein